MSWTETPSLSFTARHAASEGDAVLAVLESLEEYRSKLEGLFAEVPGNVSVVLHDSALQLALAQPYLLLARRLSASAGRRYMSGWYGRGELHTLGPSALRAVAGGPESLKALMLTPERTYTLLVVGINNPLLPPPFRPAALARLRRFGWLAEGAAQFFSGQLPHLRAALARRLRAGEPRCPPGARDAPLLAGSLFDLLASEGGVDACVRLALHSRADHPDQIVEEAFGSPVAEVRRRWHDHLDRLAQAQPAGALGD
jgi:hypothetical protein